MSVVSWVNAHAVRIRLPADVVEFINRLFVAALSGQSTRMQKTRREILAGAAAVTAAAVLPPLPLPNTHLAAPAPSLPEPDLGIFEWLEQVELDAIRSTWGRLKHAPDGPA